MKVRITYGEMERAIAERDGLVERVQELEGALEEWQADFHSLQARNRELEAFVEVSVEYLDARRLRRALPVDGKPLPETRWARANLAFHRAIAAERARKKNDDVGGGHGK